MLGFGPLPGAPMSRDYKKVFLYFFDSFSDVRSSTLLYDRYSTEACT